MIYRYQRQSLSILVCVIVSFHLFVHQAFRSFPILNTVYGFMDLTTGVALLESIHDADSSILVANTPDRPYQLEFYPKFEQGDFSSVRIHNLRFRPRILHPFENSSILLATNGLHVSMISTVSCKTV